MKKDDIIIVGGNIKLIIEKNNQTLCELKTLNYSVNELLINYGSVPLPPYISREPDDIDCKFYQTIFACKNGSVAAPTAGLHFDKNIISKLSAKNISICKITLHIGMGTFSPIKERDITKHKMHSELYLIPKVTAKLYETDIFIKPGYKFISVDHLITNFHLPKSSLLVMVSAFYDETKKILNAYNLLLIMIINFLVMEILH